MSDKSKANDTASASAQANLQVGYMHHAVIQSYYEELTKDSLEHAVDTLWANILPLYFTLLDGYGIEQQQRPWPGEKITAEFAIRCVKNGQSNKVCLVGDKRVREGSDATWIEALEQLTSCMKTARADNPNPHDTMYGIATVGHCSRFYELVSSAQELRDFSGYDGSPLHFKNNEPEIDAILCYLVKLTSY